MQNAKFKISLLFVLFVLSVLFVPSVIAADELQDTYQQRQQTLQQNLEEQKKIKEKLSQIRSAETTLQNQITYFNSQIRLLELQIDETQGKIEGLQEQLKLVGEDIDKLQAKLSVLDGTIGELEKVLNTRIRASYEWGQLNPLTLFLNTEDFYQGVRFYIYLKALQNQDKNLMQQMRQTRGAYLAQKAQLEELKKEKEELKVDLEKQKQTLQQQERTLAQQKADKEYLLQLTKNEEANYQELLRKAQAEQRAIENAINEVLRKITGRVLEGTAVTAGEIVGIQGSTGFSTGEHLHFGFYPCGDWTCPTDPMGKLNDGSFLWPIEGPKISQEFGPSSFARTGVYGYDKNGNPIGHNGVDLVGLPNAAIKTAHAGTVYYTVDGWGGQGAIVRDESGFITIYWHLQPKK